jgi:ribosomal protein S18 acetylase RimI-like enzyme
MSSISIRRASSVDSSLLTELAYKTFWDAFAHHPKNAPDDLAAYMRQAFTEEQLLNELSDANNIFLIAEYEGETAGYAKLIIGTIEDGVTAENPIELSRLYSHQRFLGKGVGQTLIDECFSIAKTKGHDVMWLGVWEYNPRAQKFYEKNGFHFVGKHIFLLGSDPQIDLLMQRDI